MSCDFLYVCLACKRNFLKLRMKFLDTNLGNNFIYLHQFEMYKTNDRDTDAWCQVPTLCAQLACTPHHRPLEQHLSSSTLLHSNILCSSTRLKIPKRRFQGWNFSFPRRRNSLFQSCPFRGQSKNENHLRYTF